MLPTLSNKCCLSASSLKNGPLAVKLPKLLRDNKTISITQTNAKPILAGVLLKTFCLILLFLSVFSKSADARGRAPVVTESESSYILEPYVGYESGYLTQKGIQEMTSLGHHFGARLGFTFWGIGMGIDYMTSSQTVTQVGQKSDYKPVDYGVFFKYHILTDFILYGTFFVASSSKVQPEENTKNFSGSGYKLGVGWRLYSFCEIGLELITRKYSKYDDQTMSNTLLGSTAGLSIAVPLL